MEAEQVSTVRGVASAASLHDFSGATARTTNDTSLNGTWFDKELDFRDPEGEGLTSKIVELITAVETRVRKQRQTDQDNRRTLVRCVLANGLRCHTFRDPSWVSFYRQAAAYPDGPPWLTGKSFARTIDLLVEVGLVEFRCGKHGVAASTYRVTEDLVEIGQAFGVSDQSFKSRLRPKDLVRLREGDAATPYMQVPHDRTTVGWVRRLRAYSDVIRQQDISLELTADEASEWVRHWNQNRRTGEPRVYRPELFEIDLYRQFNNGSLEQGGRLYGGWWVQTPKTLRPKIRINGQPTVELDFAGCAIRMLYHERGLEYHGDPYNLPDIDVYEGDAGFERGHFREAIKTMTQALINSQGKKPEGISLPGDVSFSPRFKRLAVRKMIEDKHAPIAEVFGTGAGLRLQRADSDLALDIITELMKRKIIALPIHDSFVVDISKEFMTGHIMTQLYHKRFGFFPEIKVIGRP